MLPLAMASERGMGGLLGAPKVRERVFFCLKKKKQKDFYFLIVSKGRAWAW
jgi:hypothetical protein